MVCDASSGQGTDSGTESYDELLRALADPRRRAVVEYFVDGPSSDAELALLAECLCSVETSRPDQATENHRREIAIGLHHNHLPKLDDLGLLEYDPDRRRASYRDDSEVEALVESLSSHE